MIISNYVILYVNNLIKKSENSPINTQLPLYFVTLIITSINIIYKQILTSDNNPTQHKSFHDIFTHQSTSSDSPKFAFDITAISMSTAVAIYHTVNVELPVARLI